MVDERLHVGTAFILAQGGFPGFGKSYKVGEAAAWLGRYWERGSFVALVGKLLVWLSWLSRRATG